jgi:hypothetical protein
MKTFSDLLATDLYLDVTVNGKSICQNLNDTLQFDASDTVSIDGFEILPRYQYLAENNKLTIDKPFYQWLHHVTAQGWLLKPQ